MALLPTDARLMHFQQAASAAKERRNIYDEETQRHHSNISRIDEQLESVRRRRGKGKEVKSGFRQNTAENASLYDWIQNADSQMKPPEIKSNL